MMRGIYANTSAMVIEHTMRIVTGSNAHITNAFSGYVYQVDLHYAAGEATSVPATTIVALNETAHSQNATFSSTFFQRIGNTNGSFRPRVVEHNETGGALTTRVPPLIVNGNVLIIVTEASVGNIITTRLRILRLSA